MPSVVIKDQDGKKLFESALSADGLGRHLKNAASLRSVLSLQKRLAAPLSDTTGERELELNFEHDVAVGKAAELKIGGGARSSIAFRHAGDEIFPKTDLQAAVTVPNGTIYLCWTIEANLDAGLDGRAGALGFGFNAGTAIRYSYAVPFDAAATVNVTTAITTLIASAVMPGDADDLAKMPAGAHVSISGEGKISFHAQAAISAVTNVFATPSLPIVGAAKVAQSASLSMKAGWTMEGDFELRVSRPSKHDVRVSFNRRKNRELTISAKATAGITAKLRDSELISALRSGLGSDPEADVLGLVDADVSDKQIEGLQKAIAASIDRSLSVSAKFELSSQREQESLFAYGVDVERLDEAGKAALAEALHGRITDIGALAAAGGKGVTLVASAEERISKSKTTWHINLFGALNVLKISELVAKGSQAFDPATGAFIAADQVTAKRILVVGRPGEADGKALRKVMLESLMATAAYQASRALGMEVKLTAAHSFVEQHGRGTRDDLLGNYRALIGLGLCDAAERDRRLGDLREFGATTFALENRFGSDACDDMFLDPDGNAWPQVRYERIGRNAVLACIEGDPAMRHRREALAPDSMWALLRDMGGAIERHLPSEVKNDAVKLGVISSDVNTIMWWAMAMHRCANALRHMRAFLEGRDAATLAGDDKFRKEREKLSKALEGVIATSQVHFSDPWDALALDAAAFGKGALKATVVTSEFTARYSDAPAVAAGARGARSGPPVARAAAPSWTPAQLDVFARHVVNLRQGALSSGGTVQSSKEQLEKIFHDLIPAYAAKCDANGREPHVMFVAHGGLNSETDALKHALAQFQFFVRNGVYPVYFVWETGLRETLADIVGLPGTRARVTDALIERGARVPGRRIWDEMKGSAAKSAQPNGGAKLTADLATELWKARKGKIGFHALGHSAGSIFHAHFIPILAGQKPAGAPEVSVSTLHFLAPALTSELFKKNLMKLVGSGKPVSELVMYTMLEDLELADSSMRPYGHSLLVLVTRAFEKDINTPILGLQESLDRDSELIRFFGIRGTSKVADLVYSKTDPAAPLRNRSMSITHGGFDNDADTMTSLIRRVLNVADSVAVVPYVEDAVEILPAGAPAVRGTRAVPRPAASRASQRRKKSAKTRKKAVSTKGRRR